MQEGLKLKDANCLNYSIVLDDSHLILKPSKQFNEKTTNSINDSIMSLNSKKKKKKTGGLENGSTKGSKQPLLNGNKKKGCCDCLFNMFSSNKKVTDENSSKK